MKRIFSLFLLFTLVLGATPAFSANADIPTSGQCGDNIYWRLDGDTIYIDGYGPMWDYELEKYTVSGPHGGGTTMFRTTAPWLGLEPKHVIFSDNITSVGNYAFFENNIKSVRLSENTELIGNHAFQNQSDYYETITEIELNEGLTCIGDSAFSNNDLQSLNFPSTLKIIGNNSFENSELTQLTIPNEIIFIGDNAFLGNKIENIHIPEKLTTIGVNAFGRSIKNITVDENNAEFHTIDGVLHKRNPQILWIYPCGREPEDFTVPDGTTEIVQNAFRESNITSITTPESMTYIGEYAFQGCDNLKTAEINGSLSNIESYTFNVCKSLQTVKMSDTIEKLCYSAFSYCQNLTDITLSKNLKEIDSWCFKSCRFSKINLPYGLEKIGDSAFMYNNLTEIVIPDSVTEIGHRALESNDNLKSVSLSNQITTLPDSLFSDCENLTDLKISESVDTIQDFVFTDCNSLTNLTIPPGVKSIGKIGNNNPWLETMINNSKNGFVIVGDNILLRYKQKTDNTILEIPYGVKKIAPSAFSPSDNPTKIETIILPDTVTELVSGFISSWFIGEHRVDKIIIPESVTEFDYNIIDRTYRDYYKFKILCPENSAIHQYCIDNKLDYEINGKTKEISANQAYIDSAKERGLIANTYVYPDKKLSNIENLKLIISALPEPDPHLYTDIGKLTDVYNNLTTVKKALANGVIIADDYAPDYRFCPNRDATYGDCYTYICRLMGWEAEQKALESSETELVPLTNDWDSIPHWLRCYITVLNNHGALVLGSSNNAAPNAPVTIGDVCRLLSKI